MTSGWNVYYVVVLSALLALGVPVALGLFSRLLAPGTRRGARPSVSSPAFPGSSADPAEDLRRAELGRRMNTRYFSGVNSALGLLALAWIFVPCVGAFASPDSRVRLLALAAIGVVASACALGLLYCWRKGDLDWLRSLK